MVHNGKNYLPIPLYIKLLEDFGIDANEDSVGSAMAVGILDTVFDSNTGKWLVCENELKTRIKGRRKLPGVEAGWLSVKHLVWLLYKEGIYEDADRFYALMPYGSIVWKRDGQGRVVVEASELPKRKELWNPERANPIR